MEVGNILLPEVEEIRCILLQRGNEPQGRVQININKLL